MEHTFKTFGTMLDCSRNAVMTVESVKRWIDLTAKLGCNTLHLYMEDTYEVDGQPYFGHLRGRYSKAELKQIDAYAAAHGMQVIPCIQTLAHVNALFHWPVYREIHDAADILLTGDERTYALVDGMFRTLRECLRTNIVNIGMDEADLLGLGKYLTLHGYRDRFSILMEHLRRVSEMAKKYGVPLVVRSSLNNSEGTVVKEEVTVERMLISGVALDTEAVRIAVIGLKDVPGMAFKLFDVLANKRSTEISGDYYLSFMSKWIAIEKLLFEYLGKNNNYKHLTSAGLIKKITNSDLRIRLNRARAQRNFLAHNVDKDISIKELLSKEELEKLYLDLQKYFQLHY